jgi:Uma2 family endonuclease
MIQAVPKQVTFDEFIAWYPEHSEHHYELHDGEIIEMPKPIGKHSQVAGFLVAEVNFEIRRSGCVLRSQRVHRQIQRVGLRTRFIVLDSRTIAADTRWEKESTITRGESAKVVVEVVSTNWSDDYAIS